MNEFYCIPVQAVIYLQIIAVSMVGLLGIWLIDIYHNIRSNAGLNKNAQMKIELLQAEVQRLKAETEAIKRRNHGH
jgi:uncharacterized protein YoxC